MDLTDKKRREKMREYLRKYYAANKEKRREHQRKYYAANKEKRREYQRKYYAANRDKACNLSAGCSLTDEQIAIAREQIRKGLPINFKGK